MAETQIITPSVAVTAPLGLSSAASVTLSAAVNSDVVITMTLHGGEQAGNAAIPAFNGQVSEIMGQAQAAAYGRTSMSPDTRVNIDDGRGGQLLFEGFMVGPAYQLFRGSVQPSLRAVGKGAILEHLKLDIYSGRFDHSSGPSGKLSEGLNTASTGVEADSLPQRLLDLTGRLIEHWTANKQLTTSQLTKTLSENRHALNQQGPLPAWKRLLENSKSFLDFAWFQRMADNQAFNNSFNDALVQTLRSESPGFSSVLASLAAQFNLFSVPSRDGDVGSLRRLEQQVTLSPRTLRLSTESIMTSVAPPNGLFPLAQVVMRGVARKAFNGSRGSTSVTVGDTDGQVVAVYPETVASAGDVLTIGPPRFMDFVLPFFDASGSGGKKAEDYDRFATALDYSAKLVDRFEDEVVRTMVADYCKSVYRANALAGSQVSFSTPLDLSLWPGERYEVTDAEGRPIFTGFLTGVDHALSRIPGGGAASSRLNFTHIVFPGYSVA